MTELTRLNNQIKRLQIKQAYLTVNPHISDPEDLEEEIMRVSETKAELQEEIDSLIQESLQYTEKPELVIY